jgi:hypothetical protein
MAFRAQTSGRNKCKFSLPIKFIPYSLLTHFVAGSEIGILADSDLLDTKSSVPVTRKTGRRKAAKLAINIGSLAIVRNPFPDFLQSMIRMSGKQFQNPTCYRNNLFCQTFKYFLHSFPPILVLESKITIFVPKDTLDRYF